MIVQFTFLSTSGETLFVRSDAERAEWTTEEMTLDLDFPYDSGKVIAIGQRVLFADPSTGEQQVYEVRNAKTIEPDSYQQVVAENICISELTDDHIDEVETDTVTASAILAQVLTGTLWTVGTVAVNPTSIANISRGSVWQAVLTVRDNWNVSIQPRVIVSDDGTIARYLDILSPGGAWHGLRLAIDKDMIDPSITYDDSEVATALYGYGGSVPSETPGEEATQITFADVVWTQTDAHPAKPQGQTYIEDPTATALYGRNGRPRFGYYQNSEITDPETLLEKTWETLQTTSAPKISFEGSVADLQRLGYTDVPLQLHDIALIDIQPIGFRQQLQIIRMTVDLLDPSATYMTIGAYVPSIIYIQRKTAEDASGTRGGGGGNRNEETSTWREFRTTVQQYADGSGMQIRAVQNDLNNTNEEVAIQSGRIDVAYNNIELEVQDRRDADNVLSSSITLTASEIRSEVSAANSALYSSLVQTASNLQSTITDNEQGLISYINQSASGIHQTIISTTNQTWVQDTDPRTEEGGSHTVKVGDIWIESTHQGTWDGADGFDWEHDEQYDWFAIQGAKVYAWQNDQWELVSDQQQVVSYSDVVNTADHLISQKIKGIVNDSGLLEVYLSKLEQTAEEIRAEVSSADSAIYSYISVTASNIRLDVSNRPTSVIQTDAPARIDGRALKENDIWIQSNFQNSWDAALDHEWGNDEDISWGEIRSDKIYVYHDGAWHEAVDGTVLAEDAEIEEQSSTIDLLARRIEILDGELKANYAGIQVDAAQITSYVQERVADIGSRITQTATQIRSEVHAANSQVYSSITQTASSIVLYVGNEIDGVNSSITQTASQIRMEVNSTASALSSSITQTATQIRSEVNAANSQVYSTITQTATQIRSEVNAADSRIYSSITQTASQIRSEVASAISGVNSTITQTATQIRSEVNAADSRIYSAITQTASQIRLELNNAISGVNSSITQTASQIRSEVNAANSQVYSTISQTATSIRSEVHATDSRLSTSITQNADKISLVVEQDSDGNNVIKSASIVAGINAQSGSYVKIQAAKINLSGYVTASQLEATDAKISNLTSGATRASSLKTNLLNASNGFTYQSHALSYKTVTIGGTTYHLLGY